MIRRMLLHAARNMFFFESIKNFNKNEKQVKRNEEKSEQILFYVHSIIEGNAL